MAQKVVDQVSYLPSSFSIQGLNYNGLNVVAGNFWVAGSIPAADNAHISQFTMEQNGFEVDTNNGKHLGMMVMQHSTDNYATSFKAKGIALGLCAICFSNDNNLYYAVASETWLVNNSPACDTGPCDVRLWNGGAPETSPATGLRLSPYAKYDFLVGANKSQQSVYYVRQNGNTTWTTTATVNSYNSSYNVSPWNISQAGVAFIVSVTPGTQVGNWVLTFSNVSSRTQP